MALSIYRKNGVYGTWGSSLQEDDAYLFGKALGTMLGGTCLAVGGDVRLSTPVLKWAVVRGLLTCGCRVVDCGILPLPALALAGTLKEAAAIVMVTGSPRPASRNGFKVFFEDGSSFETMIPSLRRSVRKRDFIYYGGILESFSPMWEYYERLKSAATKKGHSRLALDCGHGACSVIAPRLFRELGYDVRARFCTVDGSFPDRSPALTRSVVRRLGTFACQTGAAQGIAYDDDGDELALVDENGKPLDWQAPDGSFCCLERTGYGCHDALLSSLLVAESLQSVYFMEAEDGIF